MTKTCYIAAHELLSDDYIKDLTELITKLGWDLVSNYSDKPDVILYAGGVDINPSLYGEKKDKHTDKPLPVRDGMEIYAYQYSQMLAEKPVWNVGICRGMQLLNVLNGGKLAQHVTGHVGSKEVQHTVQYHGLNKHDTYGLTVNSYHHQMVKPPSNGKQVKNPYTILVETLGLLNDPEAILFPNSLSVGVQWHPEWGLDKGSFKLFKRIVEDYVEKEAA